MFLGIDFDGEYKISLINIVPRKDCCFDRFKEICIISIFAQNLFRFLRLKFRYLINLPKFADNKKLVFVGHKKRHQVWSFLRKGPKNPQFYLLHFKRDVSYIILVF